MSRIPATPATTTVADTLHAELSALIGASRQRLVPLLLAKAFRDEQLPQDSNYEPARALQERIRTQLGGPVSAKIRYSRKTALSDS